MPLRCLPLDATAMSLSQTRDPQRVQQLMELLRMADASDLVVSSSALARVWGVAYDETVENRVLYDRLLTRANENSHLYPNSWGRTSSYPELPGALEARAVGFELLRLADAGADPEVLIQKLQEAGLACDLGDEVLYQLANLGSPSLTRALVDSMVSDSSFWSSNLAARMLALTARNAPTHSDGQMMELFEYCAGKDYESGRYTASILVNPPALPERNPAPIGFRALALAQASAPAGSFQLTMLSIIQEHECADAVKALAGRLERKKLNPEELLYIREGGSSKTVELDVAKISLMCYLAAKGWPLDDDAAAVAPLACLVGSDGWAFGFYLSSRLQTPEQYLMVESLVVSSPFTTLSDAVALSREVTMDLSEPAAAPVPMRIPVGPGKTQADQSTVPGKTQPGPR